MGLQKNCCKEAFSLSLENAAKGSQACWISITWKAASHPFSLEVKGTWYWGIAAAAFALCATPAHWHSFTSQRMWICCSSSAGAAEKGGDRPSHPPARHKHYILCGNIKCTLRTDRNVIAHHKFFHPLTRNKTHVRSQKAVFTLTNSAGCCLAVKDLPASPKAFLCQGNKHQPKLFYDFMKVFASLSFSVVWLFFWSLKPEIKSPAHWSLLVQIQSNLLRFWYHSN